MTSEGTTLTALITSDPGLPRPFPTESYWQREPHPLAAIQSPSLPSQSDYVVIGSGITGTSVSKTLLDLDPAATITMIEARTICSGATGRNGGQLVTNAAEIFSSLKESFGQDMAAKVTTFTLLTVERMRELIDEYAKVESEFRVITKVRAYMEQALFEKIKISVKELEESTPSAKGMFKIIQNSEEIYKEYGVKGAYGALLFQAGALWPYKFVTTILASLRNQYPSRFQIEALTPVESVTCIPSSSSHPYEVHTPRGTIRAANVIYCTNAYTGHLIPSLRGRIFPVRGTMSVQNLHDKVPNRGSSVSWSIHNTPEKDPETGALADGLCYMTQHPKSGHFYFGGDKAVAPDALTADDTVHIPSSLQYLQEWLPKFFGIEKEMPEGDVVASWTGIMGFTADELPLVGKLPETVSGRRKEGEWIAAGFNGYGMPYCWLAGEGLAKMILGIDVQTWFPESFLVTEERLRSSLSVEVAMLGLQEMFP